MIDILGASIMMFALAGAAAEKAPAVEMVGKVPKVYGVIVPDGHLSSKDNPVICKVFTPTGSRFPSKTCNLKSRWLEMERASQAGLIKNQHARVCGESMGGGSEC